VGTVVVDAGPTIGWLNAEDAHHAQARAAFDAHRDDELRLPASAYAETLMGAHRTGTVETVRAAIGALGMRVDPIDRAAAEAAAALRARHRSLRLPDALVLGYAEAIGADAVLTTDRRWRRVSRRVELV
jgi:predicted nucleic acid-binding protein